MSNIQLYKEIERRVDCLSAYRSDGWVNHEREKGRLDAILHYLQVGEDSIPILNDRLRAQGNFTKEFLDSL